MLMLSTQTRMMTVASAWTCTVLCLTKSMHPYLAESAAPGEVVPPMLKLAI